MDKAKWKNVEKYTLREAMTIEDLFELMKNNWSADIPGSFKFKKGLFGKSIAFDAFMQVQPKVSVKGNIVTVLRVSNSSGVSVGGVNIKEMEQRNKAAKEGGFKAAITGGQDYFNNVCTAMRELLSDRVA